MDVKNDLQLEAQISCNEVRARAGAWLVIIGLVVEIGLAAWFHTSKTFLENWGPAIANSLIALGVLFEIHFERANTGPRATLQQRSADRLTDAQDRATKAELELATLRTEYERLKYETQWRRLTLEQSDSITAALKQRPTPIVLGEVIGDPEASRFSADIQRAISHSNTYGHGVLSGVEAKNVPTEGGVIISDGSEEDRAFIVDLFMRLGIALGPVGTGLISGVHMKALLIFVGPKPPPPK